VKEESTQYPPGIGHALQISVEKLINIEEVDTEVGIQNIPFAFNSLGDIPLLQSDSKAGI